MKNKARINYWVDIAIAVGFLLSAVSGIIMYVVPSGGYQGGRNPYYGREILFLGHEAWKDLHTWASFVMVAGVLAHLVLHWSWIVCMTRNMIRGFKASRAARACELQEQTAGGSSPNLQLQ
jgi:hypothetical protein